MLISCEFDNVHKHLTAMLNSAYTYIHACLCVRMLNITIYYLFTIMRILKFVSNRKTYDQKYVTFYIHNIKNYENDLKHYVIFLEIN